MAFNRKSNLRGTPPTSQKMVTQERKGLVTLTLSGGGNQQGALTEPDVFIFPIRPDQFSLDMPARQTVTQTINGAYQDHWGNGVGQITLSGTTGWRKHGDSTEDGYQAFIRLRQFHEHYCQLCGDTNPADVKLDLLVAVPSGFGHYRISSDKFRTLKSAQNPLLYRYEMQCTVLEDKLATARGRFGITDTIFNNNVVSTSQATVNNAAFANMRAQLSQVSNSLLPQQTYSYVVRNGDTLLSVSQATMGDIRYAGLIQQQNPRVPQTGTLVPGTILNIPLLGSVL